MRPTVTLSVALAAGLLPPIAAASDDKGVGVEPVLKAGSGQFRALLIGVNNYERLKDLRYCEEDVTALRDRLIEIGFKRDAIKCLTTGDKDPARRPSHRNITEHFDALFRGLKEEAVLVIALSGHGGSFDFKEVSGQQRQESFYCAQDARLHDPTGTMISVRNIYDRLENCPARFKMLLVDACRDQHFAPPDAKTVVDEAKTMASFVKSLSDGWLPKATLAMVSCTSGEQSYEDPKLGHGIFMYYVLEALDGKADCEYRGDRNGRVSYTELKDYVYRKTSDHAWKAHDGSSQTPSFYDNWELRDFDLIDVLKRGLLEELTNSIGMKFKLIPAGEFMMGASKPAEDADDDERPQHSVRITKPFYLGVTEVTQGQFKRVMGENPSYFSESGGGKDKLAGKDTSGFPVESVPWEDAVEFCRKLSALPAEKTVGRVYRLPTEAEWEYAARGGNVNAPESAPEGVRSLWDHAWFRDNSDLQTHEVGQKSLNSHGLYDVSGNVEEWCQDWYDEQYYGRSTSVDPQGPQNAASKRRRVLRGGSWISSARLCRLTHRNGGDPTGGENNRGFRVLCRVQSSMD